jgi:hypothetical protein
LSNKGCNTSKNTILTENENLITDQKQVCGIFNNYFVNVANDIGDPNVVAVFRSSGKIDCCIYLFINFVSVVEL